MASMTQQQIDSGFLLGISLCNATLNAPLYNTYKGLVEGGVNVNDIFISLSDAVLFPKTLTNEEVSASFLSNLTANYLDTATFNNIKNLMVIELNNGMERGTLFNIVVTALNNIDEKDPTFGTAAKYLHNKVDVAKYYALTLNGTESNVTKLQKYISTVTANSDVSTNEKINDLIKDLLIDKDGQIFSLTVNADNLMGGLSNDTFFAKSVYDDKNQRIDLFTLGGNDIIDGNAGNDTLIVDYGIAVTGVEIPGTAQIKNMEKIQVIQSNPNANRIDVDLGGLTGGQTLEINNKGGNSTVHVQTYKNVNEVLLKGNNSTIGIYELDSDQKTGLKKVNVDSTQVTTGVVTLNLGIGSLESLTLNGVVPIVIDGLKYSPNLLEIISNTDITLTQELNVKARFTGSDKKESIVIGNHESSIDLKGGDDTLKINTLKLDKNILITGGSGSDTLVLALNYAKGLSETSDFNSKVSSFEKLQLIRDDAKSNDLFNINMGNLNNIRVVEMKDSNAKVSLSNFATSGELTLENFTGELAIGNKSTQSVQTGMTINLNSKTGTATSAGSITNNSAEVLTFNAKDTDLNNVNAADAIKTELTATNLKALILNGDMNINLGTFATTKNNINAFTSTLNVTDKETVSFTFKNTTDAISVTSGNHKSIYDTTASGQNNTFTLGTLKDVVKAGNGDNTITGGGGDDEITVGNGVNTITLGTGNATVTAGNGGNTITVGNGNSTVTTGSGSDSITVGDGNSTISSGTGTDTITLGTGNNTVKFNVNETAIVFTEVKNMNEKDVISFDGLTGVTFNKTLVTLGGAATFSDYLNEANKGTTTTPKLSWFMFGGDTYVALDKSAAVTFVDGADGVIKLTGIVDLSSATLTGTNLTVGVIGPI